MPTAGKISAIRVKNRSVIHSTIQVIRSGVLLCFAKIWAKRYVITVAKISAIIHFHPNEKQNKYPAKNKTIFRKLIGPK